MTKTEEKKLLSRIEEIQREVIRLRLLIDNNKIDKHVYTVKETADLLGLTPQAVYAMIDRGELETVKLGRLKVMGKSLRDKLGA